MIFSSSDQLKKSNIWLEWLLYLMVAMLVISVFFYVILTIKIHFQNQQISNVKNMIASVASDEQKSEERQVLEYKKKIDDFTMIINNHKISFAVLAFIEEKTLPTVWFSSFDLMESSNEVKLSGEAETMEVLSHQIHIFEESENVKNIGLLNSEIGPAGNISFMLAIFLNPNIFNYAENPSALLY